MARRKLLLVATSAVIAAGCASPVPVADNFPLSYQKVARTAHHWDVVADDVVAQTSATVQGEPMKGRSVYVVQPAQNTAFDAAFREFLINRMVDRGMPVNVCPVKPEAAGFAVAPAVQVRYTTRVIAHSASMSNYRPGALTGLASGVWVGHAIGQSGLSRDAKFGAALGLGALIDWAAGHESSPTKTEIIVTTTIAENNRFLMRRSDVYYVPDADAPLFSKPVARGSECSGTPQYVSEIDEEKKALAVRLDSLLQRYPNWHGTIYSEKDFGLDGPVFVQR